MRRRKGTASSVSGTLCMITTQLRDGDSMRLSNSSSDRPLSRFHIYDKTSCAAARGHISAPIAPLGLQWQMRADVYEAERHSEHRRTTRGIEDFVWYSPRVSPVSGMSVQDHNVLPNVSSPTRTIRPLRSIDQSVFAYANTDRIEKEGTPVVKPSPSAVVWGGRSTVHAVRRWDGEDTLRRTGAGSTRRSDTELTSS